MKKGLMKISKGLVVLFLLLLALPVAAQRYMYVWQGGSYTRVDRSTVGDMPFSGGGYYLQIDGVSYPVSRLDSITFTPPVLDTTGKVLALPCALGFNLLSGIHPLGGTSTFMDLEDFLVSNIILPVGSLVFLLFVVTKKGWGWKNFMAEANEGKGLKVKNWMRGYMTYILPFLFLAIFLIGLVTYFK